MKILILLPYFNRPNLVKESLLSILESIHIDWELAFIDDASDVKGKPIVEDIFFSIFRGHELSKVKFYEISKEEKELNSGKIFGKYMNQAMYESDADLCIFLCDDDLLTQDYLTNLDYFYTRFTGINYVYSYIIPFNLDILYENPKKHPLNIHHKEIYPSGSLDASQISWRLKPVKENNIKFVENQVANLDFYFWLELYLKFGKCHHIPIFGQYKRIHNKQLINDQNNPSNIRE